MVACRKATPASFLAAVLIVLPCLARSEDIDDVRNRSIQSLLQQFTNHPTEIASAAVKEMVSTLDLESRRIFRSSLARHALAVTDEGERLALVDAIVDPTIWTNTFERSLADNDLATSLKMLYEHDASPAISSRVEVDLLRRSVASPNDIEWSAKLVRSGRWDALPLAVRWDDRSLEKYVRELLASPETWPWPRDRLITIYPHFYVSDQIEAFVADRYEWLKLNNRLGPERVFPQDLLTAYLASLGDQEALGLLKSNYQHASAPIENRRPDDKDQLYWYGLLCFAGELPGPLPIS